MGNLGKRRVGSSLAGDSGFATGKSHKYCDHLTQKRKKIFGKIMTNVLTQVTIDKSCYFKNLIYYKSVSIKKFTQAESLHSP